MNQKSKLALISNMLVPIIINIVTILIALLYYKTTNDLFEAIIKIISFLLILYVVALSHSLMYKTFISKLLIIFADILGIFLIVLYFAILDYIQNKFEFSQFFYAVALFYVIPTILILGISQLIRHIYNRLKRRAY